MDGDAARGSRQRDRDQQATRRHDRRHAVSPPEAGGVGDRTDRRTGDRVPEVVEAQEHAEHLPALFVGGAGDGERRQRREHRAEPDAEHRDRGERHPLGPGDRHQQMTAGEHEQAGDRDGHVAEPVGEPAAEHPHQQRAARVGEEQHAGRADADLTRVRRQERDHTRVAESGAQLRDARPQHHSLQLPHRRPRRLVTRPLAQRLGQPGRRDEREPVQRRGGEPRPLRSPVEQELADERSEREAEVDHQAQARHGRRPLFGRGEVGRDDCAGRVVRAAERALQEPHEDDGPHGVGELHADRQQRHREQRPHEERVGDRCGPSPGPRPDGSAARRRRRSWWRCRPRRSIRRVLPSRTAARPRAGCRSRGSWTPPRRRATVASRQKPSPSVGRRGQARSRRASRRRPRAGAGCGTRRRRRCGCRTRRRSSRRCSSS